jgi:hypothetical protein
VPSHSLARGQLGSSNHDVIVQVALPRRTLHMIFLLPCARRSWRNSGLVQLANYSFRRIQHLALLYYFD